MPTKFTDLSKMFAALYENGCVAKSVNAEFLRRHNSVQVGFHLYTCIPLLIKVDARRNLFMEF